MLPLGLGLGLGLWFAQPLRALPDGLLLCVRAKVSAGCGARGLTGGAAGSRACQTQDWKPHHQAECRRIKQLAGLNLHADQVSDVLMLGRVMRRREAEGAREDGAEATPSVSSLVWYEEDVASQENQLLAALAMKLGFVPGESG